MAVHPHGKHTCYCPECGYETEVGEGVKCNTQYCPIDGARLRAKDTGEFRISQNTSSQALPTLGIFAGLATIVGIILLAGRR